MRILGIDPGISRIGYGCIETEGGPTAISWGVLRMEGIPGHEQVRRLRMNIEKLLRELCPARAGLEKLYFSRNQKTALRVAEARGIILATLLEARIEVIELEPSAIKIAVTSYGRADKTAVAKMVTALLGIHIAKREDDASDALAAAIAASSRLPAVGSGY